MKPAMPTGTLIKNIQRQPGPSTSQPPRMGPRVGATRVGMARMAEALARSWGGKARNSIAVPTGVIMPPPTPCRMRNPTSSSML